MAGKRISAIVVIILIVITAMSTSWKNTVVSCNDKGYEISGDLGKLTEATVVEYNYKAEGETISGFEMIFATYGEQLKEGTVHVEVYEKGDKTLLGEGTIKASTIEDNELTKVKLNKKICLKNKEVRVIIYCEDFDKDKLLTMWMGEAEENEDTTTYVNGMKMKSSLLVFRQVEKKDAPYTWDLILITSMSFVVFCCMPGSILKKSIKESEEKDGPDQEISEA